MWNVKKKKKFVKINDMATLMIHVSSFFKQANAVMVIY